MAFWGIDLAPSKVAIARLPLPESGVLFVQGDPVKREHHEARIARACQLAGTIREALKAVGPEDVLAIESASAVGRGNDLATGEVFGLCLRVVFSELSGRAFLVAPRALKLFVTGDGNAPKMGCTDFLQATNADGTPSVSGGYWGHIKPEGELGKAVERLQALDAAIGDLATVIVGARSPTDGDFVTLGTLRGADLRRVLAEVRARQEAEGERIVRLTPVREYTLQEAAVHR